MGIKLIWCWGKDAAERDAAMERAKDRNGRDNVVAEAKDWLNIVRMRATMNDGDYNEHDLPDLTRPEGKKEVGLVVVVS